MRNPTRLVMAAASMLALHASAKAQAPLLECPEGALEVDVTPLLTSETAPDSVCGSPRNPMSAGPCDDGH